MAESTSLLRDVDETSQISSDDERTPPSQYFKTIRKLLAILAVVLSVLSIGLLVANIIILDNARFSWSPYWTRQKSEHLIFVMVPVIVFSVLNIFVNFPIVLNMLVDGVLAGFAIARVVGFIEAFPDQNWCQTRYGYPDRKPLPPPPRCGHWKLVSTVLMGITAGFSILIAAIFIVQLLLRSLAVYKTKSWKKPLALYLPTGEITIQVSLKVLRQEGGRQRVGSEEGTSHGPVHL